MTYTFATLDVSIETYNEVKEKLLKADYGHCLLEEGAIDMHGIALTLEAPRQEKKLSIVPKYANISQLAEGTVIYWRWKHKCPCLWSVAQIIKHINKDTVQIKEAGVSAVGSMPVLPTILSVNEIEWIQG